MVFQGEMPNDSDETLPHHEHSTSSKIKKVFLKKRPETSREVPSSSISSAESTQKKSSYAVTFQKFKRKVRKTYPLLETQNNCLKSETVKQRYVSTQSFDEVANCDVKNESTMLVKRSLSQPLSVESLEIGSQSLNEEGNVGCSYEATNSLPTSDFGEPAGFDASTIVDKTVIDYDDNVTLFSIDNPLQTQTPKSSEPVIDIALCDLFERPDFDKLDLEPKHFAPCLSPSSADDERPTSYQHVSSEPGRLTPHLV